MLDVHHVRVCLLTTIIAVLPVDACRAQTDADTANVRRPPVGVKTDSTVRVVIRQTRAAPRHTTRSNQVDVDQIRLPAVPNIAYHWKVEEQLGVGVVLQGPASYTHRTGIGAAAEACWFPGNEPFEGFHLTASMFLSHVRHDSVETAGGPITRIVSDPFGIGLSLGWQSDDPSLFTSGLPADEKQLDIAWVRDIGTSFELGAEWVVSGRRERSSSDGGLLLNVSRGVYPRFQLRIYGSW